MTYVSYIHDIHRVLDIHNMMLELKIKLLRYDKCRNNYGATLVTIETETEMKNIQSILKAVKDKRISDGKNWMGKLPKTLTEFTRKNDYGLMYTILKLKVYENYAESIRFFGSVLLLFAIPCEKSIKCRKINIP